MKLSAFALFKSPCHVFFFWFRTKFPVLGLWTNPQYMKGRLESPNESSIPYSPSVIPYDSLVHSPTNQPTNPRTSHPPLRGHTTSPHPARQFAGRSLGTLGWAAFQKWQILWVGLRFQKLSRDKSGQILESVGENPRDTWGDVKMLGRIHGILGEMFLDVGDNVDVS